MTRILTYYEINPLAWQKLVDESPYATWFQTQEAYLFYAANKQEMTPFACGVERDGELRAVCVGYVTREKSYFKQYFTRRAIIIGGPLIANSANEEDVARMLYAIQQPCRLIAQSPYRPTWRTESIYIETRNFHDYSRWKDIFHKYGFEYQSHLNFHVDCTKENILSPMSESRRRQIKKAMKNGAEIVEANSIKDIEKYYIILANLYKNKIKTPLFKLEFFLNFYNLGFGKFLLVKYNDLIIGGIMCPILHGKAIYEWFVCGLDDEYREQYPSVMATYAAIEYAKQNGLPIFDFMGAGKPDEAYGVRDFKARFGGEQVEHGRFLCIRKPLLYWVGKLGVKLLKRK